MKTCRHVIKSTYVKDSRAYENYIIRRRGCHKCNQYYTTYEMRGTDIKEIKKKLALLGKLARQNQKLINEI